MNKHDKDRHISFRENSNNKGLIVSLRKMARKANRRLNDYLNMILANHVQDHNDTEE